MSTSTETALALKDYMPLIGVVVGGFLAIIGGFASNLFIEHRKDAAISKQLALAFKGELLALANIADKRGYVKHIKSMIEVMKETQEPIYAHIHIRREYFNVFNNNVSKLGILKSPLPEKIAKFYVQANSILEDIQSYRDGVLDKADVNSVIASKTELVALMEETFSLAEEIAGDIDKLYS
jgi:hypothetical protein